MRYQRNLPPFVTFLILANVLAFVRGQTGNTYCLNRGNYTSNSTYQTNLHNLLSALPVHMNDYGFYNASVGQHTDNTVYAMVICRADIQLDLCRSCVHNITVAVLETCPTNRQVISWSFLCTLRYSDTPMYGIINYDNMYWEWDSRNVSGDTHLFMSDLVNLLNKLIPRAATGGSLLKVAFDNRTTTNFQTIYALVQCTPDLSEQDCTSCLITAAQYLSTCCDAKGNVRVYVASCDLRYGTGPFYNTTRLLEIESTTTPAVPVAQPSTPLTTTPSPSATAAQLFTPPPLGILKIVVLIILLSSC